MTASGPGQSVELLVDVVAALNTAKIEYAVIGALAASVHGVVRASQDADVVIHATVIELREMDSRLTGLGFETELRRGDVDDPIPALLLVSDKYGNRVDLLAGLKGMGAAVYERVVEVKIAGTATALRVVSREDLVAMKAFAGGPRDMQDARHCIAVAGAELNVKLLRAVVGDYGRDAIENCEKLLAEAGIASDRS